MRQNKATTDKDVSFFAARAVHFCAQPLERDSPDDAEKDTATLSLDGLEPLPTRPP